MTDTPNAAGPHELAALRQLDTESAAAGGLLPEPRRTELHDAIVAARDRDRDRDREIARAQPCGDDERRRLLGRALALAWTPDVASVVTDSVLNQAERLEEVIRHYRIHGTAVNRDLSLLTAAGVDLHFAREQRAVLAAEQASAANLPDVGEPERDGDGHRVHWRHVALKDPGTEPLEGYRIVRRTSRAHMTAADAREMAAELIAAADLDDRRSR